MNLFQSNVTGTGLAASESDYIWWQRQQSQPFPAMESQLSSYSYLLSSSSSCFGGSIGSDIYGSSNNGDGGGPGSGCYDGGIMVIFLFNHNDNYFKLIFSDSQFQFCNL